MFPLSANKTGCVITVAGQRGSADPGGLQQGLVGCFAGPYLSTALQKNTRSPSDLLPAGVHKVLNNSRPCTPTLGETADGGKEELEDKVHSRQW